MEAKKSIKKLELNILINYFKKNYVLRGNFRGFGLTASCDTYRLLADILLYTIFTTRIANSLTHILKVPIPISERYL